MKKRITDEMIMKAIEKSYTTIGRATVDSLRPRLRKMGLSNKEQDKRLIKMWRDRKINIVEGSPAVVKEPRIRHASGKGNRFYYIYNKKK